MQKKNYTLTNKKEIAVLITLTTGRSAYYPHDDINTIIEVDLEFDRSTLKPCKKYNMSGTIEYSYRLMRSERDTLANWQGRDQACQYVGEDLINKAESQVRRNLRNLKSELELAQQNPVFLQLKQIVEHDNILRMFKTDFYHHDALRISRESLTDFLFFVRESGTWTINQQNVWNDQIVESEIKQKNHRIYWYKDGFVKMITDYGELLKIYRHFKSVVMA